MFPLQCLKHHHPGRRALRKLGQRASKLTNPPSAHFICSFGSVTSSASGTQISRLSENSEFVHGRCCQVLPMSPVYTSHLPLGMLKPRFNVAKSSPPPFVPDSHFTRLTTGSERRVRKEPEGSVHSEENGWPLSHRRKPLGGFHSCTRWLVENH